MVIGVCARVALLLVIVVSTTMESQQSQVPPLTAPGRMIDLGGWRVHLHCTGAVRASQPTVVLEAGAGDFSVDWSLVQPGVAQFARVCSYDRAGSGWSDLGPRPRTMHQITFELHLLLEKAGERAPFILVGHSYGGALVRMYQSTYAKDVAGVVLVDAVSDNPWRIAADGKLLRSAELSMGRPIPPVKSSEPLREKDIPERIVKLIEDQSVQASIHANDAPRDKLPVDAQQATLVTLSRRGRQVIARRSGHHIPLDEPDLIIAAIRDIVSGRP